VFLFLNDLIPVQTRPDAARTKLAYVPAVRKKIERIAIRNIPEVAYFAIIKIIKIFLPLSFSFSLFLFITSMCIETALIIVSHGSSFLANSIYLPACRRKVHGSFLAIRYKGRSTSMAIDQTFFRDRNSFPARFASRFYFISSRDISRNGSRSSEQFETRHKVYTSTRAIFVWLHWRRFLRARWKARRVVVDGIKKATTCKYLYIRTSYKRTWRSVVALID